MLNYLDIIFIFIVAIAIILGLKRGFIKQFMFHVCTVLQIVTGSAIAYYCAPLLLSSAEIGLPAIQLVSSWFSGDTFAVAFTTQAELAAALTQMALPPFVATPISGIFVILPASSYTLGGMFGYLIMLVVFYIALFLAGYWFAKFICKIIEKLLLLIVKAKFFKIVDRLLGMVLSVAITYAVFSIVLAVIGIIPSTFLPEVVSAIYGQIAQSPILSLLYTNNYLGDMIAGLMGLKILPLPI